MPQIKILIFMIMFGLVSNFTQANSWDDFYSFINNTQTYQANFTQSIKGNKSKITGKVSVKLPEKLRWETYNKNQQISQIITVNSSKNQKLAQIYDVDLYQVIIKDLNRTQSIIPADILLGKATLENLFILQQSDQNSLEDVGWLVAKSNDLTSNDEIKELKLKIENSRLLAIQIQDLLDREIEINFSEITINQPIDDQLFILNLPEGVDIIDDTR